MSKNQYSPLREIPSREIMESLVSNLEYKRLGLEQLPEVLKENGLVNKFNSFIAAASGSNETLCYTLVGLRPDEKNTKIDEHPIVIGYNINHPSQSFGGIIDHGGWSGRTSELSTIQTELLNNSGITSEFTFKEIPLNTSGSLYELHKNGMLEGVSKQFDLLLKKNNLK